MLLLLVQTWRLATPEKLLFAHRSQNFTSVSLAHFDMNSSCLQKGSSDEGIFAGTHKHGAFLCDRFIDYSSRLHLNMTSTRLIFKLNSTWRDAMEWVSDKIAIIFFINLFLFTGTVSKTVLVNKTRSIAAAAWHSFAFTYDSASVKVYIDNDLLLTQNCNLNSSQTGDALCVQFYSNLLAINISNYN